MDGPFPGFALALAFPSVPSPPALAPQLTLHHIFYHQERAPRGKDLLDKQVEVGWGDNGGMRAAPADKDFLNSPGGGGSTV